MNILPCQKYFNIFKYLIFVKKIVLFCVHFIILIIKLRLSGFNFTATYHYINDLIVVLPQNSGPLLTIFFSDILITYNVICVVLISK